MQDDNPYRAPIATHTRSEADSRWPPTRTRRLLVGWAFVFLINLPLLLWLGSMISEGQGRLGLAAGASLVGLLGGWFCVLWGRLGMCLLVGGRGLALTQVVPVLQVAAGLAGIACEDLLRLDRFAKKDHITPLLGWPAGLLVGFVTGTILLGFALALGLLFQWLAPARWRPNPPEGQKGRAPNAGANRPDHGR